MFQYYAFLIISREHRAPYVKGISAPPPWHFLRGVGGEPAAPASPRVKGANISWDFPMAPTAPGALAAKLPPTPREKCHSGLSKMPSSAGGWAAQASSPESC